MKTKYKSKIKKAVNGLDDVAVPEAGSGANVANATAQGAAAGSSFGPYGAIIGAGVGFAGGMFQKEDMDIANKKALQINSNNKINRSYSALDSTINQKYQVMKRGGRANTKMIEIEGKKTPEIHTDKNFNIKNLGTIPHSKGGNKVEASEGDVVFNTQNSLAKYSKIASAIQNGDHKTLKAEKNKLPDDSDKAQNGLRVTKKKSYRDAMRADRGVLEGGQGRGIPTKDEVIKPNNSLLNFLNTEGIKSPVNKSAISKIPSKAISKKGKSTYTPIVTKSTPNTSEDTGVRSGNFMQENDEIKSGNNVPMAKVSVEPKTSIYTGKPQDDYFNGKGAKVNNIREGIKENGIEVGNSKGVKGNNIGSNIAQFAGVANNLIQGFKTEKPINQTYFNPQLNKYVDRSQSLRNQSTQQNNVDNANSRNLSGGNIGNLRSNMQGANIANLNRQESINEREIAKADAIDAENTNIKNQAGQYNLQRKDMYQQQIDGQKAAKQAYIDQAASDIGKIGNVREQQAYQKSRDTKADEMQLAGLKAFNGSSSFKYNVDGSYNYDSGEDNATNNRYTGADLYPLPQTNNRRKTMRRGTGLFGSYKNGTSGVVTKGKYTSTANSFKATPKIEDTIANDGNGTWNDDIARPLEGRDIRLNNINRSDELKSFGVGNDSELYKKFPTEKSFNRVNDMLNDAHNKKMNTYKRGTKYIKSK